MRDWIEKWFERVFLYFDILTRCRLPFCGFAQLLDHWDSEPVDDPRKHCFRWDTSTEGNGHSVVFRWTEDGVRRVA